MRAIPLPGHSDDGVAFVVNDEVCFSGDVLFKDAVGGGPADVVPALRDGRPDGPWRPSCGCCPGHTDETTIGREWEHNPFVVYWRGAVPSLGEPSASTVQRQSSSSGRPTTTATARRCALR